MNYYSLEFFKFYLKLLHATLKSNNAQSKAKAIKIIDKMYAYIKDREKNNESAYSKKWMRKLNFDA